MSCRKSQFQAKLGILFCQYLITRHEYKNSRYFLGKQQKKKIVAKKLTECHPSENSEKYT